MRQWRVFGVVLAVAWLFVRGVATTPSALLGEFLVGLLVGYPIAFLFRRFYTESVDVRRIVAVAPRIVRYIALFVYEVLTASLDVAYRVLAPSMPLDPGVLVVPLRVESDAAITTIANSITLTPGTLTMDYDEVRNALYVHAIDASDPESVLAPIRRWEDHALVIFADDWEGPAPEPHVNAGDTTTERPVGATRRRDPDRSESDRGSRDE